MGKGWTLPDIDGMDIGFFFACMGDLRRERNGEPAPTTVVDEQGARGLYIDQFGLF